MPPSLHSQQGDLFRDQAQHENDNARGQEKDRHISEAELREIGIEVISDPAHEEKGTDREKNTKRGKQG